MDQDQSTLMEESYSTSQVTTDREDGANNDDAARGRDETNDGTKQDGCEGDQSKEPETDEEGLRLEYDVAICGTGLVQSILASALARAGKSVIHCDGADYYGELDAVWTLPMVDQFVETKASQEERTVSKDCDNARHLIPLSPNGGQTSLQWHHAHCSSTSSPFFKSGKFSFGIKVGTKVETPHGNGTVRSIRRSSNADEGDQNSLSPSQPIVALEIELDKWKLADGQSPTVYVNVEIPKSKASMNSDTKTTDKGEDIIDPVQLEDILCETRKIRSIASVEAETILKEASRRFAIDATPTFILANGRAVQGMLQSGVADYLEFKTVDGLYWLEKTKSKDSKKRSKNSDEKETEEPITLSRVPCNKNDIFGTKLLAPMEKRRFMKFIQLAMDYATKMAVAEQFQKEEDDGENFESNDEVQSLNERHLNQGRSLARPQNKAVDTNELQILQEAIESGSMTFDEFLERNHKLSPKLRSIVRYALAWEIDTTSTSLENGMKSLRQHLQALGRYGTTAFLVPLYGSGELSQAFCRSAAVFGATYLLRRALFAIETEDNDSGNDVNRRVKGIILSKDAYAKGSSEKQKTNGTKSIKCSQVVVPVNALDADPGLSQRRVIRRISLLKGTVIPSDNGEQRHLIFIPPNTIGNSHAIHGVLLDSSAYVAPKGCAILHLTTTYEGERYDAKAIDDEATMLQRAQTAILNSNQTVVALLDDPLIEVHYVSFSHASPCLEASRVTNHPNGIHLCSHSGQVLTADIAFEQAERIFMSICPGAEFLGLSSSIDKVIRERAEERYYDDEEKNALESAIGMIEDHSNST